MILVAAVQPFTLYLGAGSVRLPGNSRAEVLDFGHFRVSLAGQRPALGNVPSGAELALPGAVMVDHTEDQDMSDNENHRETGATKYPAKTGADPSDAFSQDAAGNKKPKNGVGLTRPVNEVDDKTHQSDGRNSTGQVKSSRP